jgi:hypothetical protein
VTVLAPELTGRVGGAATLRSSGAFVDVIELASGGTLLQATDTPQEFAGERVDAVVEALRPVLPFTGAAPALPLR